MSYNPKKTDKPYRPKDDRKDDRRQDRKDDRRQDRPKDDRRDDRRQDNRRDAPRNFLDRQRDRYQELKRSIYNDNVRRSFELVNEKMKRFNPKEFIGDNYKKFSDKVKSPENKKLVEILPAVFLAITLLAVKNKKLISPFIEAFQNTKVNVTEKMTMTDKALLLIYEYGKILYKNASILKTIEASMTVLTLFLEDIPGIFAKMESYKGISQFNINKNIIKNAVELQEDLIDKPAKERKKEEERKKEQKEQQELRDAIRDLKTKLGMKDNFKPEKHEASALIKSIEKLEKASRTTSSSQKNKPVKKEYNTGRSSKFYSDKGKFTGRR